MILGLIIVLLVEVWNGVTVFPSSHVNSYICVVDLGMSLYWYCRSFLYPNVVGMGITDDTRADRMQTWTRLSFAPLSFRVVIVCWWI
jgi:hypothetical protein